MSGAIITYEEFGTDTRRRHRHNGYSSGFSPTRDQWRDHGWPTLPSGNPPVPSLSRRHELDGSAPPAVAALRPPTRTVAGKSEGRQ